MIYRRFGRTGLRMPVISCGGMRFQFKWQDTPLENVPREIQANLEATIRRAFELGIHHFETARGYGSSERQLGLVLPTLPRDEILVQTKVAPAEDAAEFVRNFHDSLERLRLDHVDLLALHGVNNAALLEWTIRPGGCLEAARRLQQKGLVRHVGFSTHGPLDVILRAIRHEGAGGFDYVNLHWYYIFQRNLPAIEEAGARDMGVFIISPSDKGGMLYKPSRKLEELCAPLHPMTFNDLFCLLRDDVHTISIGAARPQDFDLHVEAVEQIEEARRLVPPIARRLDDAMIQAIGRDFARRWREGLPDWSETPGQVNIPTIVWLSNLAAAYDMFEYARMRYELLGSGGHWFPGCDASKIREIDLSPALSRSPFPDRIQNVVERTARRHALYALLGDLPDRQRPVSGTLRAEQERDGYMLQTWDLDLNGLETVPAFLARPPRLEGPAPAVLYNHSHGGEYRIGKRELVEGRSYLQPTPYAEELARLGHVVLCIDAWVFGERSHTSEMDTCKAMLWQGRVLWGMMVYDSLRAIDFLVTRPEVDPRRVATLGMSMGSTMAWWLAALDERIKVTVDICCLTEFHTLLAGKDLSGHGIYYFVPGLLKHFTTAEINALIAPRAHLAVAGLQDPLTPVEGLDIIDAKLKKVYADAGHPERWKLLRCAAGHQETLEARREVLAFLQAHL